MQSNSLRACLLAGASLLLSPLPVLAGPANKTVAEQETLVVTASRSPQSTAEVIPSLTVITREEIERLLATDLMEVLALVPGIDVVRTGPTGSATSVFVRGSNSNHVLVLIDGVRVASANTGAFAWEHLPAAQIERIEILRGPRASLYGSDAIGGVIQIFTRENRGPAVALGYGSYASSEGYLGYGQDFASDRGHVSLQLGGRGSQGFSATNPHNWFYQPDKDGYANLNASLKARWQTDWGVSRLFYLETRGDTDFDQGNSDSTHQTLGASVEIDRRNWQHQLLVGANRQDLFTTPYRSYFQSERLSADWLAHYTLNPDQRLGFGLSWYQDIGQIGQDQNFPYRVTRTDQAVFVNWQGQWGAQRLEAAVRYDDFSVYDGQLTGNLGWALTLAPDWEIGLSAGNAFRAPSINETFYYMLAGDGSQGNPLFPEKSLAAEFNLSHLISNQAAWHASFFKQKIDDLIQFVPLDSDDPYSNFIPRNVARAEILGMELSGQWQVNDWALQANVTLQDTLDKTTNQPLLRRPDRKASLLIDRQWGRFSAGATVVAASHRQDFGAALAGYATLDLRFHYRFNEHWKLGLKAHNLADRDYELAAGYNTPGRSYWLQLNWQSLR
jgi:vitamin B12 transporter